LPFFKLKHYKITSISSYGMVSVIAIAAHTAMARVPATAIF